mmetsp:Transcript_17610/g.32382  ORF Transcript_17610/g.32382 Transcript_17610/m.32382 type:complete len:339 (-) Transcript_17610:427-1443(-)
MAKQEKELEKATAALRRNPWLGNIPFISSCTEDLSSLTLQLATTNPQDFHWAVSFEPDFIAELMLNGFLTMCEKIRNNEFILLPKLHVERCLLDLSTFQVKRSTRKKAKGFKMSLNKSFCQVCQEIVKQHGRNWFQVPLVEAFTLMNARGSAGCSKGRVHLHSVELWTEDGELVAGEVGYAVGKCYTSLSGFSKMSSAGSVQMAATGAFLAERGFVLWDLGMGLEYKFDMGATSVPRIQFLLRLAQARAGPSPPFIELEKTSAVDLIHLCHRPQSDTPPTPNLATKPSTSSTPGQPGTQLSKSQKKKLEKAARRKAWKAKQAKERVSSSQAKLTKGTA